MRLADEAHHIGASPASESYLNIDRVVDAARRSGASLIHPGYGFLAENEDFAQACVDAGLTFVGPTPEAIALMGSKTAAREAAIRAGVPVVPGTEAPFDEDAPDAAIVAEADRIGYPLVVKAVAGGGGKGMRTVSDRADLVNAVRTARSEAKSAFGDAAVYLERRIVGPRHIEIQLLADTHGTVVPFVERECSIQRRHQKVVEESPSRALDVETRQAMAECAAKVARVGRLHQRRHDRVPPRPRRHVLLPRDEHTPAGRASGHRDGDGRRSGALADQDRAGRAVDDLARTGADAARPRDRVPRLRGGSRPRLHALARHRPGALGARWTGIRDDRGVEPGFEIPVFYDSMIAKLIVTGDTRPDAIARLSRVLAEYRVAGVTTTVPFFQWLVGQPEFLAGEFDTTYLDRILAERKGRPFVEPTETDERDAAVAAGLASWLRAHRAAAGNGVADTGGGWRRAARMESLRGGRRL